MNTVVNTFEMVLALVPYTWIGHLPCKYTTYNYQLHSVKRKTIFIQYYRSVSLSSENKLLFSSLLDGNC